MILPTAECNPVLKKGKCRVGNCPVDGKLGTHPENG